MSLHGTPIENGLFHTRDVFAARVDTLLLLYVVLHVFPADLMTLLSLFIRLLLSVALQGRGQSRLLSRLPFCQVTLCLSPLL